MSKNQKADHPRLPNSIELGLEMNEMLRNSLKIFLVVMGFSTLPVAALACSDRPGTPTKLEIPRTSPTSITLQWTNTASESGIYWDIDIMRNGKSIKGFTGTRAEFGGQPFSMKGRIDRITIRKLEYGPTYCFRVRARTASGSNGCVSAHWSHVVCSKTIAPSLFGNPRR